MARPAEPWHATLHTAMAVAFVGCGHNASDLAHELPNCTDVVT